MYSYLIFLFFLILLFFSYAYLINYNNQEFFMTNKDLVSKHYDKFNINCLKPYKRPPVCVYIEGNYRFNMINNAYCKEVCPEMYKDMINNKIPTFKDKLNIE